MITTSSEKSKENFAEAIPPLITYQLSFTISSSQYLYGKRKLCVVFIDYEKAFHRVDRISIWNALRYPGTNGRIFTTLQAIYRSVTGCVRRANGETEYIDCPFGLQQG